MLMRVRSVWIATVIACAVVVVAPSAMGTQGQLYAAEPVVLNATLLGPPSVPFENGTYTLVGPVFASSPATYSDAIVTSPDGHSATFSATVAEAGLYLLSLDVSGSAGEWYMNMGTTVDLSVSTVASYFAPDLADLHLHVSAPGSESVLGSAVAGNSFGNGGSFDSVAVASTSLADVNGQATVRIVDATNVIGALTVYGPVGSPLGVAALSFSSPIPPLIDVFLPYADSTAPTVTITTPADGSTFTQGTVVNAVYGCVDDLSSTTCVGDVPSGDPIDTSTVGSHAFSVTATDAANNTTTATVNYTVTAPVAPCPSTIKLPFAVPTSSGGLFVAATLSGDQTGNLPACHVAYKLKLLGLQIGSGTFDTTYASPGVVDIAGGNLRLLGYQTGVTFNGTQTITGNSGALELKFDFPNHRSRVVTVNFTVGANGNLIVNHTRVR